MPKYDVAVIGAGIAGLAAAALLRRSGKNVVILDPADRAGGVVASAEAEGFRFTSGPVLTYGFEQGGAFSTLYAALGLGREAERIAPFYQVILPDRRITVSPDHQETLEELRREFPGEIDTAAELFRTVSELARKGAKRRFSSSIQKRRSAGNFLKSYQCSRELTAFFAVQSLFFYGLSLDHLSLELLVRLIDSAPFPLPGGFNRVADRLLSAFQMSGGTWLPTEPCPEFLLQAGRVAGLRTTRDIIESRNVLVNFPIGRFASVLFLGIQEEVVPVGMLPSVIGISDYDRPEEFFSLSLSTEEDKDAAPRGMRALSASFPPSATASAESPADLVDRISAVIPFLEDFLVVTALPDPGSRTFTFPPEMDLPSSLADRNRNPVIPTPFRNIMIIDDSDRALYPSVIAAHAAAAKWE